jgi:hypothetical protein
MKRLEEALSTLELATDLLEESAAAALAPKTRPRSGGKAAKSDDMADSLFSPAQLTTVKRRLDDAIGRLEDALEVADGSR